MNHILWICTDQQRFDTLGCYGNPFVRTPNLDRLASEGARFEHAFCQNPVCTPSRASFLTGRYPRTCRCRQNGQSIPHDEVLVTKLLADGGYTCGLSGKLHLSACHPSAHPCERRIDDGYHVFHWSHSPGSKHVANAYTLWLRSMNEVLRSTSWPECRHVQAGMPARLHQTTWCVDRAIDFIEAAGAQGTPWLFSVNIFDPHHGFDPPAEYLERYRGMIDGIPLPSYVEGELDDKPVWQRVDHQGAYGGRSISGSGMSESDHRWVRAAYWAMCDLIDDQVGRLSHIIHEA